MNLLKTVDRIVDSLGALLLLICAFVTTLQIIFRYVLNRPLNWPLEVSLFCFIWMVWLGGAGGIREEKQVRIEFTEKFLPRQIQKILAPAITILNMVFMGIVIFYGVLVTEFQTSAVYDILPFSRAYLYVVAPAVGSLIFIYLVRVLIRQIRGYSTPPKTPKERDA